MGLWSRLLNSYFTKTTQESLHQINATKVTHYNMVYYWYREKSNQNRKGAYIVSLVGDYYHTTAYGLTHSHTKENNVESSWDQHADYVHAGEH